MKIVPDFSSNAVPVYRIIHHELKEQIIKNKYLPGEKLPSENEIKRQYGVSRHTVQHVFQLLVNEGLVTRRRGAGSFVKPLVENGDFSIESISLRLGGINKPSTPITHSQLKFSRRVAELTRKHAEVTVYHSSELGQGKEQIKQVAAGVLDMFGAAVDWLELIDPAWGVTNIPFLFRDLEHVKLYTKSEINEELKARLLSKNIRVISDNWFRPPRALLSKKPCFNFEDLNGVNFGVPPIPIYQQVWQMMGVHPITTPWSNVKKLLDTGEIEATEAPCDAILGMELYRSAPYITYTKHLFSRVCIIMAESRFQALRSDIQEAIITAAEEIGEFYSTYACEMFLDDKQTMIQNGARFIETDTEPFRERVSTFAEKLYPENCFSKRLYNHIKAL